jgi:hypothetical protein
MIKETKDIFEKNFEELKENFVFMMNNRQCGPYEQRPFNFDFLSNNRNNIILFLLHKIAELQTALQITLDKNNERNNKNK